MHACSSIVPMQWSLHALRLSTMPPLSIGRCCHELTTNFIQSNTFVLHSLVCEPNVVQLRAHRLGILLYKFWEEFDLRGTSMGLNPEGFGSNLS